MAKIREVVETEWHSCKECPFIEGIYGPDGFGMRDEIVRYECGEGYFETSGDLFKSLPTCIPPFCKYSDNKLTPNTSLQKIADKGISEEELICYYKWVKQGKAEKQAKQKKEEQDKKARADMLQANYRNYINYVNTRIREDGYI